MKKLLLTLLFSFSLSVSYGQGMEEAEASSTPTDITYEQRDQLPKPFADWLVLAYYEGIPAEDFVKRYGSLGPITVEQVNESYSKIAVWLKEDDGE